MAVVVEWVRERREKRASDSGSSYEARGRPRTPPACPSSDGEVGDLSASASADETIRQPSSLSRSDLVDLGIVREPSKERTIRHHLLSLLSCRWEEERVEEAGVTRLGESGVAAAADGLAAVVGGERFGHRLLFIWLSKSCPLCARWNVRWMDDMLHIRARRKICRVGGTREEGEC